MYPGSSQFFNDVHRKTGEPGIQFHVTNVNACTPQTKLGFATFQNSMSKLVFSTASSDQQTATAKYRKNEAATHDFYPPLPSMFFFLCATLKNWEEPGDEGSCEGDSNCQISSLLTPLAIDVYISAHVMSCHQLQMIPVASWMGVGGSSPKEASCIS